MARFTFRPWFSRLLFRAENGVESEIDEMEMLSRCDPLSAQQRGGMKQIEYEMIADSSEVHGNKYPQERNQQVNARAIGMFRRGPGWPALTSCIESRHGY